MGTSLMFWSQSRQIRAELPEELEEEDTVDPLLLCRVVWPSEVAEEEEESFDSMELRALCLTTTIALLPVSDPRPESFLSISTVD